MAETGHIKNVEHFQMMIAAVTGYGGVYKLANAAGRKPNIHPQDEQSRPDYQRRRRVSALSFPPSP